MNSKRRIIFSLVVIGLFFAIILIRDNATTEEAPIISLQGKTMGTTYNIKYVHDFVPGLQNEIDSMLFELNESLSTYVPDSKISNFNSGRDIALDDPYFYPVIKASDRIHEVSEGSFDPTVMPLVKAWGFGPGERIMPDSSTVDSLLKFVGFEHIAFSRDSVRHLHPQVMLDFSAIAKGFGVDQVASILEDHGVQRYMVEIGGEVICRGKNDRQDWWTIGIDNPQEEREMQLFRTVPLKDRALATSGNYRNFYELDGKRYSHTISPFSGFPVEHTLLSASVFANDCMTADALATAFMVMGKDKAIEILESHPSWDGHLIYFEEGQLKTYASAGVKDLIQKP